MKNYIKSILLLLVVGLGMSACVSHHAVNKTYFRPNQTRLEIAMQDMEYVGQVTVTAEYKTYFGMFVKILTINGQPYNPRQYSKTYLTFAKDIPCSRYMKLAMHKVTDTYAEPDYVIPTKFNKEVDHMVGGRIIQESMTMKVYRLK